MSKRAILLTIERKYAEGILIGKKPLKEAWEITWKQVSDKLGKLPKIKTHCGSLAVGGLRRAIRKYYSEVNKKKPDWLPEEITKAEKHALEEEALAEKLKKKYVL